MRYMIKANSQMIKDLKFLGALSSILLIIGSIKFTAHEVPAILGLLTLLYVFRTYGLTGRFRNAKLALIMMITNILLTYTAAAVITGFYGPIKVTIIQSHAIMNLSPNMPMWLRYPSNQVALVYSLMAAAWPLIIAYSYFLYRSIDGLSRIHKYAGVLLMISAALYIALIGAFIMLIAYALLLIAWLMPINGLKDNEPINFTRRHAIRIVAWSMTLSLMALVISSSLLFTSLNPQYYGLDPINILIFTVKHFTAYTALTNYSIIEIGITNQTHVPNSISILGYVGGSLQPYSIRVGIGTNSCSNVMIAAPTSTYKTNYTIPIEIPPTPLTFSPEPQVIYEGTAVRTIIKSNEVSWIYVPALSMGNHVPVPNGFLLNCMVNNYNYVFPINITIIAITNVSSNYFMTNYGMSYVKTLFIINRTTIRLVNESSGTFIESSVNYVNVVPIIYLPLFIYYVVYDRDFYRRLFIGGEGP